MTWVNTKNKSFLQLPSNKVQHLQDSNKKLVNFIKQIKYFDDFGDNLLNLSQATILTYT